MFLLFVQYQIMKKLDFGEGVSISYIFDLFPYYPKKKIAIAIDLLGKGGFLEGNLETRTISPRTLTSFYDFKISLRKAFFETSVSISAIIVAIATVLELWQ